MAAALALEPRQFGARGGDADHHLQLAAGAGDGLRLVERGPGVGLAAPRPYQPEHGQRSKARHRGRARSQHLAGRVDRLLPLSAQQLQLRPRPKGAVQPHVGPAGGGELDRLGQARLGGFEVTAGEFLVGEVVVGAADQLVQPIPPAQLDAAGKLRPALGARRRGLHLLRPNGDQDVQERLGVVELLGEPERGAAGDERLFRPSVAQGDPCRGRVGHGQLPARPYLAEQGDRLGHGRFGHGDIPADALDLGQLEQRAGLLQPVAQLVEGLHGGPARPDRLGGLAGQVALVAAPFQQGRSRPRIEMVSVPQGPLVLRGGLPVRAERGRLGRGRRRVPEHGGRVHGRLGVMRQPRQVHPAMRRPGQHRQRPPVQGEPTTWVERLLDREPGQFVAEGDGAGRFGDHPRGEAAAKLLRGAGNHLLEQPHLGMWRRYRHRLHHGAAVLAEPGDAGQHGIAHRFGYRLLFGCQNLGDEERVASRLAVELRPVEASTAGQILHRRFRQRRDPDPGAARWQLTEQHPQWMGPVQLVIAIRRQEQDRPVAHAAGQEPEHVEGRLVGPVQVFEHHDGGPSGPGLGKEGARDLVGPAAPADGIADRAGQFADVNERAKRPGGEQGIAGAHHDPRASLGLVTEVADQARLTGARLAANRHEPALARAANGGPVPFEFGQLGRPFKKARIPVHGAAMVTAAASGGLSRELGGPRLAHHGDPDLARIGQLFLHLLGHVPGDHLSLDVVHPVRRGCHRPKPLSPRCPHRTAPVLWTAITGR